MSVYEYMNFKRIIPSKYYNARCFTCSLIDLPVIHWQIKWFYIYMLCTSYKLLSSFLIFGDVYIVNAPQNLTPFCIHWDTSIFVINEFNVQEMPWSLMLTTRLDLRFPSATSLTQLLPNRKWRWNSTLMMTLLSRWWS